MPNFNLYNIYDMYSVSRTNYLAVANDPLAVDTLIPQIKRQQGILGRGLPAHVRASYTAIWDERNRDFINRLMDNTSEIIRQAETIPGPIDVEGVLIVNLEAVELEVSRSDFLKFSVPAQQAFRNLYIVKEQPNVQTPSAIFTSERHKEKYLQGGVPVYSGVDINLVFMSPHFVAKNEIIKTISYSSSVAANEVMVLGRSYPKGYTDSPRTIAGSMIGTLSVNDPLMELHPEWFDGEVNKQIPSQDLFKPYLLTDQIPLFDILIIFQNEFGFMSAFTIFGIKIPDHGIVMSIDDSVIEVTYQYKAMDVDVIHEVIVEEDEYGRRLIDVLHNDEYILKHNMVMKGESLHRSILDVPYLWNEIWDNLNELAYLDKHVPASKVGLITLPPT